MKKNRGLCPIGGGGGGRIFLAWAVVGFILAIALGCTSTPAPTPVSPLPTPTPEIFHIWPAGGAEKTARFGLAVTWEAYIRYGEGDSLFPDAARYGLWGLYRVRDADDHVVVEGEFNSGIEPFLGDEPGSGVYGTIFFDVDRTQYEPGEEFALWATCQWRADGMDTILCQSGEGEGPSDDDGYLYLGSFTGAYNYSVYMPVIRRGE